MDRLESKDFYIKRVSIYLKQYLCPAVGWPFKVGSA